MTLPTPPIEKNISCATAFTLYLEQIGKIVDLQSRFGGNRSSIVRQAIDFYYAAVNEKEQEKPESSFDSSVPETQAP